MTNYLCFIGVALSITLLARGVDAFAQDNPAAIAAQSRPSVMELLVSGPDPNNRFRSGIPGSGFIVHSDKLLKQTFLFTAAHVIGPPSDWLQDGNGKVSGRTIRLRRQEANDTLKIITDEVRIIAEDHERDVAVLAI